MTDKKMLKLQSHQVRVRSREGKEDANNIYSTSYKSQRLMSTKQRKRIMCFAWRKRKSKSVEKFSTSRHSRIYVKFNGHRPTRCTSRCTWIPNVMPEVMRSKHTFFLICVFFSHWKMRTHREKKKIAHWKDFSNRRRRVAFMHFVFRFFCCRSDNFSLIIFEMIN